MAELGSYPLRWALLMSGALLSACERDLVLGTRPTSPADPPCVLDEPSLLFDGVEAAGALRILAVGEEYAVSWGADGRRYFARLDERGELLTSPHDIATTTDTTDPNLLAAVDGAALLVYQNHRLTGDWRIFLAPIVDGRPIRTDQVVLLSADVVPATEPAVASLPEGGGFAAFQRGSQVSILRIDSVGGIESRVDGLSTGKNGNIAAVAAAEGTAWVHFVHLDGDETLLGWSEAGGPRPVRVADAPALLYGSDPPRLVSVGVDELRFWTLAADGRRTDVTTSAIEPGARVLALTGAPDEGRGVLVLTDDARSWLRAPSARPSDQVVLFDASVSSAAVAALPAAFDAFLVVYATSSPASVRSRVVRCRAP